MCHNVFIYIDYFVGFSASQNCVLYLIQHSKENCHRICNTEVLNSVPVLLRVTNMLTVLNYIFSSSFSVNGKVKNRLPYLVSNDKPPLRVILPKSVLPFDT